MSSIAALRGNRSLLPFNIDVEVLKARQDGQKIPGTIQEGQDEGQAD